MFLEMERYLIEIAADDELRAVEPEALEAATNELALRLAKGPTLAYARTKASVYQDANMSLESALDLEARNQHIAMRSHDSREGAKAFLEKREPKFLGH
jgi:enoyl-CoA hydratase/carnithine racemase